MYRPVAWVNRCDALIPHLDSAGPDPRLPFPRQGMLLATHREEPGSTAPLEVVVAGPQAAALPMSTANDHAAALPMAPESTHATEFRPSSRRLACQMAIGDAAMRRDAVDNAELRKDEERDVMERALAVGAASVAFLERRWLFYVETVFEQGAADGDAALTFTNGEAALKTAKMVLIADVYHYLQRGLENTRAAREVPGCELAKEETSDGPRTLFPWQESPSSYNPEHCLCRVDPAGSALPPVPCAAAIFGAALLRLFPSLPAAASPPPPVNATLHPPAVTTPPPPAVMSTSAPSVYDRRPPRGVCTGADRKPGLSQLEQHLVGNPGVSGPYPEVRREEATVVHGRSRGWCDSRWGKRSGHWGLSRGNDRRQQGCGRSSRRACPRLGGARSQRWRFRR